MTLFFHALLLFGWFSCSAVAIHRQARSEINVDGSDRFNEFDWALTKEIGATLEENVVISPISLKLVLAMLYEGSGGNTSRQLEKALNIMPLVRSFTSTKFSAILQSLEEPNNDFDITIGTKLFIDEEARPKKTFEKKIDDLYNATIEKINFKNTPEAVAKINAWANSVSKGHIQHLVSEADTRESTVMLLLNAVYFKGLWEHPFPVNSTSDDTFYVNPGLSKTVKFMKAVHTLKYIESSKASIVRLPYMGGKFAMYVVLPFEKDGLQDVISTITPDSLREILPKMLKVPVQIQFPRFKFEFASSLAPALQKLGITDMFNSNADLTEIAEGPKELVVSNVIQKAGINVNEQGSTAYAATAVDLTSKFGEYTMEFKATHPFLFFIEDETTRTVIFVGKVVDPSGIGKPAVQATSLPPEAPGLQGEANASGQHQGGVNYHGGSTAGKPTESGLGSDSLRFGAGEYQTISTHNQQTFSYFDIELAQRLKYSERGNWVASPSSIKSVLGLLLEGAGGTSLQQLIDLLRLPKNVTAALEQCRAFDRKLQTPSQNATLKSLNKILVNKDVQVSPNYKVLAADQYGVTIEKVDFNSPSVIVSQTNNWVNHVTHGLISQLLSDDSLNPSSSLVILNAIYFKGDWKIPFDKSATKPSCFFINANDCTNTDFMKTTGFFKYGIVTPLSAQLIELDYSDSRYSMVILLPMDRDGLDLTIRNLPFNSLFPILETLPLTEVTLTMPKFTIEYSLDLVPTLMDLGAVDIFTDKANLEEMLISSGSKSKITGVVHKAKIIVNEKGTIAAAASAVYAETLMSRQSVNFKADHPFIFFIRDKNTGYLFEGVFVNPSSPSAAAAAAPQASKLPFNSGNYGSPDRLGGEFSSGPPHSSHPPTSNSPSSPPSPSSSSAFPASSSALPVSSPAFPASSSAFPSSPTSSLPSPSPSSTNSKPPVIKNTILNRRY